NPNRCDSFLGQSDDQGPCRPVRAPRIMSRVDEAAEFRSSGHWRLALWGFRLAVLSLAILVASLVALVTTGDGAWVLFGALCGIVAGDIGIFTGYVFVKRDLSKP